MGGLIGVFLIILSAIGFGAMALCANIAYADGVDTSSLLALRFVLAVIALSILALIRRSKWPTGKALQAYLLMGCVYSAMAGAYFSALHFAPSSTVALVLYTFPILVAIFAAVLKLERFSWAEFFAVSCSSLGLFFMLGGSLNGGMAGLMLALLAALLYATYIILGSKVQQNASPIAASCLVLGSAAVIFSGISIAKGVHLPSNSTAWLAVLFLAFFSTAMAITAFVAGLNRVGPTMAAILSTLEPIVTIGLGMLFLKESLNSAALLGGVLILGAAIGLTLARMRRPAQTAV